MSSFLSYGFKVIAGLCLLVGITGDLLAADAYQGFLLFNQTCFLCHGEDGKGHGPLAGKLDVAVADLSNGYRLKGSSDQQLFHLIQGTVRHGTSEKMPQWGLALAEPQIKAIISYVRFLQHSPHGLPGDPELGEKVYMDKCVACHGRQGEGDGPLTQVIKMKPANHTDSERMNKFSNSQLIDIVTRGTKGNSLMPGWKNRLTDEEIAGAVSYIRLLSTF